MDNLKTIIKKILIAETKVLKEIRETGLTPDEISVNDYVEIIYEKIRN